MASLTATIDGSVSKSETVAVTTSPFDDLDSVYAAHHGRIFRFLLSSLRDPDAAHTLTQDTFLRAWQARASYRGECAPATWLTRIALNLLRDHTRTGRFRFWKQAAATATEASEMPLPDPASSNESRLIAREELGLVWDRLQTLSEQQRTIFLLRFSEEMELSEIATATGMQLSTVKTHLYRALAALRRPQTQAASKGATTRRLEQRS